MKRFLISCAVFLLSSFFALSQNFVVVDSTSKKQFVPKDLGAKYFIPDSSFSEKWLANVEIQSQHNDRLLLFQELDKLCVDRQANSFQEYSITFDSLTQTYTFQLGLFALNQFDIDNLPYLPPGIYVLNLTTHSLDTEKPGTCGGETFLLQPDTFHIVYGEKGAILRLDGEMGSSYKSKRRKMEREFVFSAKGGPRVFSYKSWFAKRKGIYVSLKEPIGEWILFGMGYNWWTELAPILHEDQKQ